MSKEFVIFYKMFLKKSSRLFLLIANQFYIKISTRNYGYLLFFFKYLILKQRQTILKKSVDGNIKNYLKNKLTSWYAK